MASNSSVELIQPPTVMSSIVGSAFLYSFWARWFDFLSESWISVQWYRLADGCCEFVFVTPSAVVWLLNYTQRTLYVTSIWHAARHWRTRHKWSMIPIYPPSPIADHQLHSASARFITQCSDTPYLVRWALHRGQSCYTFCGTVESIQQICFFQLLKFLIFQPYLHIFHVCEELNNWFLFYMRLLGTLLYFYSW